MVGDGVNDYADIDSAEPGTRFQATDDFSLCAWFNKDTISAVGQLIGRNDVNQGNFFLRIQNSKLRAQVQDTSTSPTHTARVESSVLSSATWYFGTLVYTGSTKTLELYINAVSHGTDNEPLLSGNLYSQNMLSVFKRNQGTGDVFFGGKIPITMIYNVALTPAEIQQNFNEDKARYGL